MKVNAKVKVRVRVVGRVSVSTTLVCSNLYKGLMRSGWLKTYLQKQLN